MSADLRHRIRFSPCLRDVFESLRLDLLEHLVRNSDIGHAYTPAMHPPRQQQVRRLAPKERDGFARANGDAHNSSGGAVHPPRQIDSEIRRAVGVDRFDYVVRLTLNRPIETGSKQRTDSPGEFAARAG